ncbi:unnamed protein product [Closterium sp. NIES-54]
MTGGIRAELASSLCTVRVEEAVSSTELRAAASLRSFCFFTCPPDRSSEFVERHLFMKAMEEAQCLEDKVAGLLPGFNRVSCLVATVPESSGAILQPGQEPGASLQVAQGWVVGTLDLNLGLRLPGENLGGKYPDKGLHLESRRAYLSNVCVAPAARRLGVAYRLMQSAQDLARSWGVEHLYVHVVKNNDPARLLYLKSGYEVEQEEKANVARSMGRPARLLLHLDIR